MFTQICKWDNNLAINLPEDIADQACLSKGMNIEVSVIDGKIIIMPTIKKYTLIKLLAGVTLDNHGEVETGFTVGNEIIDRDEEKEKVDNVWDLLKNLASTVAATKNWLIR